MDEQLSSGTGMYLLQSTWEAIEKETKLDPKLVVLDFCNANRHRSVAKGTIMSCMLVEKGIEHGLLHLIAKDNWRYMRCGGSCSHCRDVDVGRATNIAQGAFKRFFQDVNESMTTTPRTVPTSKGGLCQCVWLPGALRPGQVLSSAVGRTSSIRPQVLRPLQPA